jgi:hypothetical protein
MEDYIPILVVAVVALIKLFSSGKKQQSQPPPENFPELPELSDLFPDFVTTPEKEARQEEKVIPAFKPLGAVPLIEGGRTIDSAQKLEQMREEVTSDKVPKEKPERVGILEDFEIRKAIIYHEILQPKYLE